MMKWLFAIVLLAGGLAPALMGPGFPAPFLPVWKEPVDEVVPPADPGAMDPAALVAQAQEAGFFTAGLLRFEPNVGQAPEPFRFVARADGHSLYLADDAVTIATPDAAVTFRFAKAAHALVGLDPEASYSNYFIGNDPDAWRTDVPHYRTVRFVGVHDGGDLLVGSEGGALRFDHVLRPHADVASVSFVVEGATASLVDGRLRLAPESGPAFDLAAPVLHQDIAGQRRPVDGGYVLQGQRVGYWVGDHDPALPLTIDPTLRFATYLGNFGTDVGYAVAVHAPTAGSGVREVFVAGSTNSLTVPTGFGSSFSLGGPSGIGSQVAFIAKYRRDFSTATTTTQWYTFFGGTALDRATAIAVDTMGNVHIAGGTTSEAIPIVNPVQDATENRGTYDGSTRNTSVLIWEDVFVAKIGASGNSVLFSTYLGARAMNLANGVAVDSNGDIIVVGQTAIALYQVPYPVKASTQLLHGDQGTTANIHDGFITKIRPGLPSTFVFSTHLGTTGQDYIRAVALDPANNIYVTGSTANPNTFPTTPGAYQTTGAGTEAFVAKFTPAGARTYITMLGGGGTDIGIGIDVSATGVAYVTGSTSSNPFPVCVAGPGPCTSPTVQTSFGGGTDAFFTVVNAGGNALVYSTYVGGTGTDEGYDVSWDPTANHATIVGRTLSTNFPTNGVQAASYPTRISTGATYDAFVTRIAPGATAPLVFSTFFGGTTTDSGTGVVVDSLSNTYVVGDAGAGLTAITPTQATIGGGTDAYLGIFHKAAPRAIIQASAVGATPPSVLAPPTVTYTVGSTASVALTGAPTVAGDMPIATYSWQLFDGGGVPIGGPVAGVVPPFSPIALGGVGARRVCLTVTDTDTRTPLLSNTNATCLRINFQNLVPTSAFTAVPNPAPVGATVTFTNSASDPDGTITLYNWWFGDGGTSTLPNPTHAYGAPGTYNVRLMVTDNNGATANATVAVTIVSGPTALFTIAAGPHVPGATVDFFDASTPGSQPITSWLWDFGDSQTSVYSSTPPVPVPHVYAAAGTFPVRLTIGDGTFTHSFQANVVVGVPAPNPQADAYAAVQGTPMTVVAPGVLANDLHPTGAPMTVVLDTGAANGIASVSPDGGFTYTPNAGFVGTDTWTYTVSDGANQVVGVAVQMTVRAQVPPAAVAFASVSGLTVQFIDHSTAGDNPIVGWAWEFGDGASSTQRSPTHTYAAGGTFIAQLTVTDSVGLQATRVLSVTTFAPSGGGGAAGGIGGGYHGYGVAQAPEGGDSGPLPPSNVNRPPVAVGAATPGHLGQAVQLDARGSSDPDGHELSFTWRQVGGPAVDVVDALRPTASFIPIVPGTYVFELAVGDPYAVSRARVETNVAGQELGPTAPTVPPGAAEFAAVPAGLAVRLTADDVPGASYRWDLGDGTVLAGREVAHRYQQAGAYAVTLTVSTGGGLQTATHVLSVAGSAPVAPDTGPAAVNDLKYTPSGASATPTGMWVAVGLVALVVVSGMLVVLLRRR